MKWVRKQIKKLSDFFRGIVQIAGVLFGIRYIDERLNTDQVFTAAVAFVFGVPIGMLFMGTSFSAPIWAAIILWCLCLVNLDDALLLIARFAEDGVQATLHGEVPND